MLVGRININRDGKESIQISIEDESSGVMVIRFSMSPEDFALALTGLSDREVDFEVYNSQYIGKQKEFKSEIVEAPDNLWEMSKEEKLELLRPYCVDGWLVNYPDDLGSPRRRVSKNSYEVTFIRFVDVKGDSNVH